MPSPRRLAGWARTWGGWTSTAPNKAGSMAESPSRVGTYPSSPRRAPPAPGAPPWSRRRRCVGLRVLCVLSVGLTVLARGVSVWQREALSLDFPLVALAPHVGEGALQVGDALVRGFELDGGDRIGVSALKRG